MRIDVRSSHDTLVAALLDEGFSLERICPVMTHGGLALDYADDYCALVAQAFG
jgi:hypothetical protein